MLTSVLGLLLAAGCAGPGPVKSRGDAEASPASAAKGETAAAGETKIHGPSATLVVFGMSCPLCANNVDKQLLAVHGVKDVKVDMGTGHVRVGLDPAAGVTRQQLAAAVDRSGFTLNKLSVP